LFPYTYAPHDKNKETKHKDKKKVSPHAMICMQSIFCLIIKATIYLKYASNMHTRSIFLSFKIPSNFQLL